MSAQGAVGARAARPGSVDRIVENLGWTVLAVIVALQLFGGR